jgi:hypothetical protein
MRPCGASGFWVEAELLNHLCLLEQQGRRRGVAGAAETDQAHMGGVREPLDQQRYQPLREVFIQQQLRWTHVDRLKPQLGW